MRRTRLRPAFLPLSTRFHCNLWVLTTCSGGDPNAVSAAFKDVTTDEIADAFKATAKKVFAGADNKKIL